MIITFVAVLATPLLSDALIYFVFILSLCKTVTVVLIVKSVELCVTNVQKDVYLSRREESRDESI
jgi:hypothetical protein